MLFLQKYVFCIASLTILATACKKEDADTTPNLPANYMTATIDGSHWTATEMTRTAAGGDTMIFTGNRSNSKPVTVQLMIHKYRGVGSYKLNDTAAAARYTDNGTVYKSASGTITISADDQTHVMASFQFSAQGTVTGISKDVNNGQLSINK